MLADGNPMIRVLMTLLYFEVIVFGLSVAIMIMLDDMRPAVAGLLVAATCGLALVAALRIRKNRWGQLVGWAAQVAGVALGLATPIMFVVGGLFAGLYLASAILGKRLEVGNTA